MFKLGTWLGVVIATVLSTANARKFTKDKDAIRLENIKALTFYKDVETTHRRVPALPQLACVAGSGCPYYAPDTIRCVNSGTSYDEASVEWACTASLPPEFKLGSTNVVCEGYDSPDDDYILKGSCALEYRLLLTDLGHDKLNAQAGKSAFSSNDDDDGQSFWPDMIFWLIFALVAGYILYSLFQNLFGSDQNRRLRRPWSGRRGQGGWDDNDDDPPPPYFPNDPYEGPLSKPKTTRTTANQAGSSRASSSRTAANQNRQSNQRPWWQTFGAGAATGGAAAWMAANARNNRQQQEMRQGERQERPGRQSWTDGMFGRQGNSYDSGRRNGGSSSRSFSNSQQVGNSGGAFSGGISESRYESTGFGGTRRR